MLRFLALAALLAAPSFAGVNVVFILVDDMGWADVSPFGNSYHRTPNIERLAREGMRFAQAYAAAPNCSPTRASILTGKWPARLGLTQYLPGNVLPYAKRLQAQLPPGLPLEETVLAEPLARAGYATASIGKWHLGGGEYLPEHRGFDLNFGGGPWGSHRSMFAPYRHPEGVDAPEGEYLTDRQAAEAERFFEANRDRPFFLYLPLYAVHAPVQAKPAVVDSYAGRQDPTGRNNATYAAMVEGVDGLVGRVTAKLAALGLEDDTALFFFSDNGGVQARAFNGGLRRGKGWLYEGGIREPLIVKLPGRIAAGSKSEVPVSSIDFYPTILDLSEAQDIDGHESDGLSLLPLLEGKADNLGRDTLYWHYPHYSNAGGPPCAAIREGRYKLIEFFEDGNAELYDLQADPAEKKDLAAAKPELAERLRTKLAAWRESVNAKPAPPNPHYDPKRAKEKTSAE